MTDENLISLQPGTIIAGRYEVVKCLGAGSMGLVYACRHRELSGHLVGIKVLFPEVAQDKVAKARFRNEIFASYGVSHPNVVRAYEYISDGDLVAYTMELVGGGDLAQRLATNGKLPVDECVKILGQMCSGVQAIHDAGIVHRDLKPENILLSREGDVKIADFGIARTGHGPKLTEHGGVVGTIDYVSPEYMLNSQVDWRSDIYAMGILGFEMITGESPFRGDSVYATMTKRLKEDPKPPSALRPDCPPKLDEIILKAMRRDPEERYQAAAEMFYDLQTLMPQGSISSGTYIQLGRSAGEKFQGPAVNPQTTDSKGGMAGVGAAMAALSESKTPDRDVRSKTERNTILVNGNAASSASDRGSRTPSSPGSMTAADTMHNPMQIDRVFGGGPDIASDEFREKDGAKAITLVSSVTFGDPNLKLISSAGRRPVGFPLWLNFIIGFVVFVVGVTIGVYFYNPELFKGALPMPAPKATTPKTNTVPELYRENLSNLYDNNSKGGTNGGN